jgi:ABC-2 type transport system ATP-binding protein
VGIIKDGCIAAVEDIDTLRKKQLRKVQVEFSFPVRGNEIACDGMSSVHEHGSILNFLYSGDMKELLHWLVKKEIQDLVIEEPTLEEIFMHYYTDQNQPSRDSEG